MRRFLIDFLLWGFLLWLIGYVMGIALFFVVPSQMLGWIIMPIGIAITVWFVLKRIKEKSLLNYVFLGVIWTLIAIVCDYFLLVKVFKPADGYYKLDVYLYYLLTLLIPIIVGWKKTAAKK